jgi:phosphoenolpyruvate carboxykinase (ATP)
LNDVEFVNHEVFGLAMPAVCAEVPSEILNPRNTWADKNAYDAKANELAEKFVNNFEKFKEFASEEIMNAAPRVAVK